MNLLSPTAPLTTANMKILAERYGVASRTVYRWRQAGADVCNPESVATLLLKQRAPSGAALESITSELETETIHE